MKSILLSLMMLFTLPVTASDYQQQIDTFFKNLKEGNINAAVSELYSSNAYVSAIPDQIQQVKNQLSALDGLVGKMLNLEKLDTYQVGNSMVHVTYVAVYDRQPIRFEFQFFKAADEWRVYSMSFDDDLDDEIKVLARRRALNGKN